MRKNLSKILFAFFLTFLLFQACRNELDIGNKHQHSSINNNLKTRKLIGSEAQKIKTILQQHLQKTNNQFLLHKSNSGEIDYSEISEAIDSTGITNYTFRILNHPDDSFNIFHNLILSNENNEFKIYMIKYEMNEETVQQLQNIGGLESFGGTVTSSSFDGGFDPGDGSGGTTTCGPTSIGGGNDQGGGTGSGTGTGPGSGGGGGTGSGGGTNCSTVSFVCSDCGKSYSSWDEINNACRPFRIDVLVSYYACRQSCNPGGGVVVAPPKQTPCEKIKTKQNDTKYAEKYNALNQNSIFSMNRERGFFEREAPPANNLPSTFIQLDGQEGTHGLALPENLNGIVGLLHSHNNESNGNPSIKIFSPTDVRTFINHFMPQANSHLGSYTSAYSTVVTSLGSYTLQFSQNTHPGGINYATLEEWNTWYKKKYRNLVDNDELTQANVEKVFTQFLKEKVNIAGVEVYRVTGNTAIKLEYDGENKPVKETNCP